MEVLKLCQRIRKITIITKITTIIIKTKIITTTITKTIIRKKEGLSPLSYSKYFFKNWPVWLFSFFTICSGVPTCTIVPPLSPPSGPKSII